MCAARVRPERLVRQDASCASGRTFFFLMQCDKSESGTGTGAKEPVTPGS